VEALAQLGGGRVLNRLRRQAHSCPCETFTQEVRGGEQCDASVLKADGEMLGPYARNTGSRVFAEAQTLTRISVPLEVP
jgi:hypothetical protein